MPRLENWSFISSVSDPYKAPEQGIPSLRGNVYGHPRFEDGSIITISSPECLSEDGAKVITHSGSEYKLGVIDSGYEKAYPNARQRLFEAIKKREVLK